MEEVTSLAHLLILTFRFSTVCHLQELNGILRQKYDLQGTLENVYIEIKFYLIRGQLGPKGLTGIAKAESDKNQFFCGRR